MNRRRQKNSCKVMSSGYLDEKEATTEKTILLEQILSGKISESQVAELITKRRLEWLRDNLPELKKKYKALPPEEQAYRIIYFEHLNIRSEHLKVTRVSPTKIKIDSYNFCPYLEACKELGLETKEICNKINHDCFEQSVKEIHPSLVFYRNYQRIRPGNDYCEEYIELKENNYINLT